jgi:hypothetical protein
MHTYAHAALPGLMPFLPPSVAPTQREQHGSGLVHLPIPIGGGTWIPPREPFHVPKG